MSEPWNDENSRRWEEWKINREAAQTAHDLFHQQSLEMFRTVISFGLEAVRTSALINGGASVAAIALVGSAFSRDVDLAAKLSTSVAIFASGVFSSGLASGFAYLAQYAYHRAQEHVSLSDEFPYVHHDPKGSRSQKIGVFFHIISVAMVISSYLALGWGAYWIWSTISQAGK